MRAATTFAALVLLLLVAACSGDDTPGERAGAVSADGTSDLARIVERGELRILRPRRDRARYLPRHSRPLDFEVDLVESYAASLGVEPVWIFLDSRDQLIPSLLEGEGDVIAANMTATAERKREVAFTVPVAAVREQLVTRSDEIWHDSMGLPDLEGRWIAIRRSSSFWNTVGRLKQQYPGIEVRVVDEDVETEEIIHRVAIGQYDVTVADSNLVEACLEYRTDINTRLDLTPDRPIAWAVRPDSDDLRRSLDGFLTEEQLTRYRDVRILDDLPEIKKRRRLRMITRNTAVTYFLWRGELMGFEYELMREFARQEGLRLDVIVPPNGENPVNWLREGKGDLVSAALTPTDERREGGVVFTRPYNTVAQIVVARTGEEELRQPSDLNGRTFVVRESSSYHVTLEELKAEGLDITIQIAPTTESTEEIIGKVASGEYDLTLADGHLLAVELTWRDDVRGAFPLTDEKDLAWAVRQSSPELEAALNRFIRHEYRGLIYNVIYDRYFTNPDKIRSHHQARLEPEGAISPYDDLVKKYAAEYGFDWRLILAQMFQESRFDPAARSFAGALGLMQILPRTGREFGFEELHDPETAIHAGVRYLAWTRDRFEDVISVRDRTWFALAAYNAGAGHVRYARRLAAQRKLDPDVWFDNVEAAMLLLSRPQFASSSPHGYCRCAEPVNYVRDIRARYQAYVEMPGS